MSSASVYRLAPSEKASESHGKDFQLFSPTPPRCYCKERDGMRVTGFVVSHSHCMSRKASPRLPGSMQLSQVEDGRRKTRGSCFSEDLSVVHEPLQR